MEFTVYSLIMTVLWSSLLIILYSLLQRNHRFLDMFSVSGVILLYMFCVVRMFVPFEFPWVTVVCSDRILNTMHAFLYMDVTLAGGMRVNIRYGLLCIWMIVSLFLLIRLTFHYLNMNRRIERLPYIKDKELDDCIRSIQKEDTSLNVEAIKSSGIDAPFSAGILRKKILIPDHAYSQKELFYIIRHEYMHLKNRDPLVQLLVNILCAIYWWNPFVYLLRRDMEHNFEIRCDQMVVQGMDDHAIADYMETILKVFRTKKTYKKNLGQMTGMLGIIRRNGEDIRERFQILLRESDPGYKTYGKPITVVSIVIAWVLSYSFIFQPNILPTMDDMEIAGVEDAYEVEADKNYILHCIDDTYELITCEGDRVEIRKEMVEKMEKEGFQVKEEWEVQE